MFIYLNTGAGPHQFMDIQLHTHHFCQKQLVYIVHICISVREFEKDTPSLFEYKSWLTFFSKTSIPRLIKKFIIYCLSCCDLFYHYREFENN